MLLCAVMTSPNLPLLPWLRSSKVKRVVFLALGLLLTVGGYFLWQVVGGFVYFFTVGSGAGHHNEQLFISSGFFVLHAGVLSWLAWRGVLYHTWWAWALNIGVAVGLFAGCEFFPWYRTPRDSTYQRYNFVRGSQRYAITLETPRHSFDVLDVTNQENGSTTSLLMGDYQVRHDTIFLREWVGPRQYFIYHRTLVGFDKSPQAIPLTREKDITPWTLW